eukprot:TRINITY_DN70321_c0_g1_i1.p1 TRINITY_DN70321_c0_g1~~TRINITY_DN70321_c0_g1_i1.p1  ORF type:complete len:1679 (+),score=468.58 TRINITY_DN70321_c0_g1_i1:101-5038(+)
MAGGYMLSAGLCGDGQLGLGVEDDRVSFTPVSDVAARGRRHRRLPPAALSGTGVASISCGWAHSFAVLPQGEPVAAGYNAYGQLGLGHTEAQASFVTVSSLGGRDVAAVSCGGFHTLALTRAGKVFATGMNEDGQLGLGHNEDVHAFQPVPFGGRPIARVATGWSHSFAITRQGELLAAGRNTEGQLGLGHCDSQSSFAAVDSIGGHEVVRVSCGGRFTFALTADGRVFSTGLNEDGQLGLSTVESMTSFTEVDSLSEYEVGDIACGGHHVFALTKGGEALACGLNDDGQLGLGHRGDQWRFVPVHGLAGWGVQRIFCGGSHTCALTETQEVLAAGQNCDGQLGCGHNEDQPNFCPVASLAGRGIALIACGGAHTLVLTEQGQDQPPTARDDAPEPSFELPLEVWQKPLAEQREAGLRRCLRHEGWWRHGVGCIASDSATVRSYLRAKYLASAAITRDIDFLKVHENHERCGTEQRELTARQTFLTAWSWAAACAERVADCREAEELGSAVLQQEEAAARRALYALEHAERRVVYHQTEQRRAVASAECKQCEWHHRAMIRAEQAIMHRRQAVLYADMQRRLEAILEYARKTRRIVARAPEPPALYKHVVRVEPLESALRPLAAESIPSARAAAAAALRVLDTAHLAATRGDLGAVARRDGGRLEARRLCAEWLRELDAPGVVATHEKLNDIPPWSGVLCADLIARAEATEEASDAPTPRSAVTYGSTAFGAATQVLEEPPVFPPPCVRQRPGEAVPPPRWGDGTTALAATGVSAATAIAAVKHWQQEYLDACAAAEVRTNRAKAAVWNFLTVIEGTHLPRWDHLFDELQKATQAEEKVKQLTRGVSRVPERECAECAELLLCALALADVQIRTAAAERWQAAVWVAEMDEDMATAADAQTRIRRLRRLVGKEGVAGKVAALKAALDAGALTPDAFEEHRRRLESAPQVAGDTPSLVDRRESVRKRRYAFERAMDQLKLQPPPEDAEDQLAAAQDALQESRRLLHAEHVTVADDTAALWAACARVTPELEHELRQLTSGPLAEEFDLLGYEARALVVDRRRAEYAFDDEDQLRADVPLHPGKHRMLWVRLLERRVALKEYRMHVKGTSLVMARRHFARGLQEYAMLRHPAITAISAAFMQEDDSGCAGYLQMSRMSANLDEWLAQNSGASADHLLNMMCVVAVGLEYMHQGREGRLQGVLHSDIKPENVLIENGQPVLTDIDLELDVDADRGSTRRTYDMWPDGKPGYAPPELCIPGTAVRNELPPTAAADVYALGRVFERMLMHPSSSRLDQVGPLRQLVARMTDADPQQRPLAAQVACELLLLQAAPQHAAAAADSVRALWQQEDQLAQQQQKHGAEWQPEERRVCRGIAASELRYPPHWKYRQTAGPHRFALVPLTPESNRPARDCICALLQPGGARTVPRYIWRVENHNLWRRYAVARQRLRHEQRSLNVVPSEPQLDAALAPAKGLRTLLDAAVRERYLLHGVCTSLLPTVLAEGPSPMLNAVDTRRLGVGVYMQDHIAQADLYASTDSGSGEQPDLHARLYRDGLEHPGDCRYVLVCRALLGCAAFSADAETLLTQQGGKATERMLWSSPQRKELAAMGAPKPRRYDSIVCEQPGAHREIVVRDADCVLPEYLVAYAQE